MFKGGALLAHVMVVVVVLLLHHVNLHLSLLLHDCVHLGSRLCCVTALTGVDACHLAPTATLVRHRELVVGALGTCLEKLHVSHVCTTPTMFATLAACNTSPARLPHLQVVALGGEPMPRSIVQVRGEQTHAPRHL